MHENRRGSDHVSGKEPTVERVSESVHHLPDIIGGPTILLGESITIVDTGVPGSGDAILAAVHELGRSADEVADIVITHADGDHVGSLAALVEHTGATVWAGAHEADVIEGKAAGRGGDVKQSGSVDRRFAPGETLPLQGGIETVDTHGHTAGHVSLFLRSESILIAGDALNNREGLAGSAPEHTANAVDARAAVSVLAALHPESIVFGHGPSITGGAARELEELDSRLG
jgi:glyoxylase-like metal-dependent hydrolase (beta-lactamase superfamily II)